ncbi:hypothetical protein AMTRI_Chr02g258950 [Amborella trichopoda]|uniref:Phytocyanin domain-containing protein n=1 Tax=Amborella trichopoda TaxID=13333 RepID=W1NYV6_AMBTC|nr:uclacyanin 1-like [Amborella trichopoda]ERM99874.1 hypothetical protein AMTR_s00098p00173330 [Amborella trichopoda]|eukprot:XP_020519113.1 uclacyanin 1-like [Amborella trichopoda]
MPSMKNILMVIVVVAMLSNLVLGNKFTVGSPGGGWGISTDIQTWAAANTFHPGDTLTFQHASTHNVLEVTKVAHDSCQLNSPLETHTDENTSIELTTPGKRYFICGTPGHCTQGMKLEIDTVSLASSPADSPSQHHKQRPIEAPSEATSSSLPPFSPAGSPLGPSSIAWGRNKGRIGWIIVGIGLLFLGMM